MKTLKTNRFLKIEIFKLLMKWVVKLGVFYGISQNHLQRSCERFSNSTISMIKTQGELATIAHLKKMRVSFMSLIADQFTPGEFIKYYKSGLPFWLGPEINALWVNGANKRSLIRFILTMMSISRVITGWKRPDFKPLGLPPAIKDNDTLKDFQSFIKSWKFPDIKMEQWKAPHGTTKAGPNGPALINSSVDYTLFRKLYGNYLMFLKSPRLSHYLEQIVDIENFPSAWARKGVHVLRRLSFIDDKEGKKRIIGIVDYWSQTILKNLHDQIMEILRTFEADRTYSQHDFTDLGNKGHKYHSFDLTSATDRFPMAPQKSVIENLHGQAYSQAWEYLMVGQPFYCDREVWKPRFVRYNCGQPMGAYSSWATFTLTHHLLVQYCAYKEKLSLPFKSYYLLGDDIVIKHDLVAKRYLSVMNDLGVEISKPKTLIGEHIFEFAKRVFLNNEEVTMFPVSGMVNTIHTWTEFTTVLQEAVRRDYVFTISWKTFSKLWWQLGKSGLVEKYRGKGKGWHFIKTRQTVLFWLYLNRFSDYQLLIQCLKSFGISLSCNLTTQSIFKILRQYLVEGLQKVTRRRITQMSKAQNDFLKKLDKDHGITMGMTIKMAKFPVFSVINSEIEQLTASAWTAFYESDESFMKALYEDRIILGSSPDSILGQKSRVRAVMVRSRSILDGILLWVKDYKESIKILNRPPDPPASKPAELSKEDKLAALLASLDANIANKKSKIKGGW